MNIIIETLGIITTVLAVAGVVLNNRMDRKCFWFWIVSNAISCGLHLYIGLWSLAARDAAFLALAFDGLRLWWLKKNRTCYECAEFDDTEDGCMRKARKAKYATPRSWWVTKESPACGHYKESVKSA
jgi:hypothetical protein